MRKFDQIVEIIGYIFKIIAFLWFMVIIFLLVYLFSYYVFQILLYFHDYLNII
jgi:hypothetical protein